MGRVFVYLFEIIMLYLFVRYLWRALRSAFGTSKVHFRTSTNPPWQRNVPETRRGEMVRDPVCGMFVSTELSHRLRLGNQTLHFCSSECMQRYQKDVVNAAS
jgi:YHS domain-containing protein